MEEFIKILTEKGIVDKLQKVINDAPFPIGTSREKKELLVREGIKDCLKIEMLFDPELMKAFTDCALNEVTKAIPIKINYDNETKHSIEIKIKRR